MDGSSVEHRHSVQGGSDVTWFPSPLSGPGFLHLPKGGSISRACFQDHLVNVSVSHKFLICFLIQFELQHKIVKIVQANNKFKFLLFFSIKEKIDQ